MTIHTDTARTRNDHPETSHAAAERVPIKTQQKQALGMVNYNNGLTAKEIGIQAAMDAHGLDRRTVEDIVWLAQVVQKRSSELQSMELVEREDDGRLFINDKGLIYLERR